MSNHRINPLLLTLINDLRRLSLDVEYRGEGDQLHLVGNTKLADDKVLAALKSAKKRMLEVLVPLWQQGGGQPVRLPQASVAEAAIAE